MKLKISITEVRVRGERGKRSKRKLRKVHNPPVVPLILRGDI
jgi:hypothetical protein